MLKVAILRHDTVSRPFFKEICPASFDLPIEINTLGRSYKANEQWPNLWLL
jgi:hypothetical protein